jgi:hypothetical protein
MGTLWSLEPVGETRFPSSSGDHVLVASDADFLWFVDQALTAMTAILRQLGDELANTRPELDGANTPYAVLTHCLGVMEYWGGAVVAGRPIERDRPAEFRAEGRVCDLAVRVTDARHRLEGDIAVMEPSAPPRHAGDPEDSDLPYAKTQGGVLLHILEELYQHLGQMEISRHVLLAR